mgnify:CR=1 FL=1
MALGVDAERASQAPDEKFRCRHMRVSAENLGALRKLRAQRRRGLGSRSWIGRGCANSVRARSSLSGGVLRIFALASNGAALGPFEHHAARRPGDGEPKLLCSAVLTECSGESARW